MKPQLLKLWASAILMASLSSVIALAAAPPLRVVPVSDAEKPTTKATAKKAKAPVPTPRPATPKVVASKAAAPKAATASTVTARPATATRAVAAAPVKPAAKAIPKTTSATPVRQAAARPATPTPAPKATPKVVSPAVPPKPNTVSNVPLVGPEASSPVSNEPTPATRAPATGGAAFSPVDWRPLDPENALIYDTTKGRIIVELAPELAPEHVARVKELAREGFYNGLTFHRVIGDFMAQGGDPKGDGTGGSDKPNLRGEFNFRRGADTSFVRAIDRGGAATGWVRTIPITSQPDVLMERTSDKRVAAWGNHCPGIASMARGNDENSANSQFFLMRAPYPTLDRRYTIWGRAVLGADVIRALKVGEPVVDPDKMLSVRVLADLPEGERPVVMIQRTDGPLFQARLKASIEQRGAAFSNCDIAPEARIFR